ncbi:Piso0_003012 [Millerozyma farinosa CBS 7064]|uniref:Piso0_003012 protein n=1 Tax=Pichia sorbitophila (strain ATCC MYA-4447 / BCRC 22081 / CBS 7064 / NBRC 10061 / NRRL Y-12695) TaxID=559304 RepID=G8YGY3_PICSO|nr:Piso0_003012 [Millerozyma farinosa CBS 7064]CCE80685.1 Piso0_003012 [Millerozyma farinosa CBS 7064]
MGNYYVKVSAELNGVTDLCPVDTPDNPFEYTFKIECTKCREEHPRPVTINRFEQYEVTGSKGSANFVYRCRMCKSEHSASISRTDRKYTSDDNGKAVPLLIIDARGVDFTEFKPVGQFQCTGAGSGTAFDEVDLEDGEWFDYDDKEGAEVSIVDVKWEITN